MPDTYYTDTRGSVIVIDNAPYHSIQENKPPTRNSVKAEMISWLEKNNVPFAAEMRKTELFQLVERHKTPRKKKTFRIDQVLKFHGHDVLRLPPYTCDLSPIELAWVKVKRLIREKNVAGEMSLSVLKDVTMDAFLQLRGVIGKDIVAM
jgi:hypothetical protein